MCCAAGVLSTDACHVGDARCAGQRLRSGAFAPDFPVVIVVQAYGLPFRFPRAYRRPAQRASPTRQAALSESSRALGRVACLAFFSASGCGGVSCGARPRPAARAASWGLRGVLRRVMALRAVAAASRLFTIYVSTPAPDGRRARDALHAHATAHRARRPSPPLPLDGDASERSYLHSRQRLLSKLKELRMYFTAARAAVKYGRPTNKTARQ